MFLNVLFVMIVQSQEMLIWLRVTFITEYIVEQYIIRDFLHRDQIRLCIELKDVPNILIFQNHQQLHSIQLQDKIGQWVEIIEKQESILVDGNIYKIDKQKLDGFKFIQILRNYDNFFIEILKDEKYKNFFLSTYEQQYLKCITFNTFISDQDASIILWFKFMIGYNTKNYVYFRTQQNQIQEKFQNLLEIERDHISILDDQNEFQQIRINGMIWNQIIILLEHNIIHIFKINRLRQIQEIVKELNIKKIVNKELIIEQQGLYVSHLSIEYNFTQYYCSPGCINCLNNICLECSSDQYLVDNQCTCRRFYQSQSVDGSCISTYLIQFNQCFLNFMKKSLYNQIKIYSNKVFVHLDIFRLLTPILKFSIVSDGNNFKYISPSFQNQLCYNCLLLSQMNYLKNPPNLQCCFDDEIIEYIYQTQSFVPITKINEFIPQKQQRTNKQSQLSNRKLSNFDKLNKSYQYSKLFDQYQYPCPYNCECRSSKNIIYCENLIENKNYIQSNIFGIPLFQNYEMNIFQMEINVVDSKYNPLYIHNTLHYNELETIINTIDFNSLILTGIHIIQFEIQLQISDFLEKVMDDLNRELQKLKDEIKLIKQSEYIQTHHTQERHYAFYYIPLIHLIIKSNKTQKVFYDWKINIIKCDKITLMDFSFNSNYIDIVLIASTITLININFNNSFIKFQSNCDKIIIKNMNLQNIKGSEFNSIFEIDSQEVRIEYILIINCTSNNLNLFHLAHRKEYSDFHLFIDFLLIQFSQFTKFVLIEFFDKDNYPKMSVYNFIINHSTLYNSYIISSDSIPFVESIVNFKLENSYIYDGFLTPFRVNKIDNLILYNCTLQKMPFIFFIKFKSKLEYERVIIKNIILQKIILTDVFSLFTLETNSLISFVTIQNTISDSGRTLFKINTDVVIGFSFVSLLKLEIEQFAVIRSSNVLIHNLKIEQSRIVRLFQIESVHIIIQWILMKNIDEFDQLFDLASESSTLTQILIADLKILHSDRQQTIIQQNNIPTNFTIDHIKFCNNYFRGTQLIFIKFQSLYSTISYVFLTNNYISLDRQNSLILNDNCLISMQSSELVLTSFFVYSLKLQSTFSTIIAFYFDSYNQSTIKYIALRSIIINNCHLFYFSGTQTTMLQYFDMKLIQLYDSILIQISYACHTLMDKFTFQQIKTNQPLFYLKTDVIFENIRFNNSSIRYLESETDIIWILGYVIILQIETVDLRHIISKQHIKLILQIKQKGQIQHFIQILHVDKVNYYNSNLGLADLQRCQKVLINNSRFIEIILFEPFLTSKMTQMFHLSSSQLSKIKLSFCTLIDLGNSQSNYLEIIFIENSIISSLEYFMNQNQSLLQIYYIQLLQIFNTIFIDNQCIQKNHFNLNCSLISIQFFDHFLEIYFSNLLFQQNKFVMLFQLEQTNIVKFQNMAGIDLIKKSLMNSNQFQQNHSYFHIYTVIMMRSQQPTSLELKFIRCNVNNYHLLEQLIFIKFTGNRQDITLTNNLDNEVVYLPSGSILNQYFILDINRQSYKKYIDLFLFQLHDSDYTNCSLNLIQNNSIDSLNENLQTYQIQINTDLSNILQFNMDPYNKQHTYLLELICSNSVEIQQIQYKIKPFTCQMGEYYHNQQCKKCKIEYWYNTIQKHSIKCDQYDQSIIVEMKPGLLKLQNGFWRPNYHNRYFTSCELQSNQCQGGWQVGDQSCAEGSLGAQCSECDIYNKRGSGSYSKLNGECLQCSDNNKSLIVYVAIIFLYQLISTYLACNKSQKYIQEQKLIFQQNKYYNILNNLSVDQISILIKILLDVYIKIILINQLNLNLPDIINIPLNLIPTQLINNGLYCNIFHLGPNILVLELILHFYQLLFCYKFVLQFT